MSAHPQSMAVLTRRHRCHSGVVTSSASEISLILAIKQQAKWLKSLASAFAVIGEFRSI
jgi:hypothetical protein